MKKDSHGLNIHGLHKNFHSTSPYSRRNNVKKIWMNKNFNHRSFHSRTNRMNLHMGMDVKIRIVGRKNGSEQWLEDAYSMYDNRLKPTNIDVQTIWHKNDNDLIKSVDTDTAKGHVICFLDPLGKMASSDEFSSDLYQWLELGGSRLSFVIGGAEGLPSLYKEQIYASRRNKSSQYGNTSTGIMENSNWKVLSLSALTFTHQFARTLLMEQIYRASEIRKGEIHYLVIRGFYHINLIQLINYFCNLFDKLKDQGTISRTLYFNKQELSPLPFSYASIVS